MSTGKPLAKRLGRLITAIALTILAASSLASSDMTGRPAPDFALKSSSGDNLRLSEFRGDVVMINFWATWCGPCRQEMPLLDELYQRYNRVGFNLLGVNIDDDSNRAMAMIRELGVEFRLVEVGGDAVHAAHGVLDFAHVLHDFFHVVLHILDFVDVQLLDLVLHSLGGGRHGVDGLHSDLHVVGVEGGLIDIELCVEHLITLLLVHLLAAEHVQGAHLQSALVGAGLLELLTVFFQLNRALGDLGVDAFDLNNEK